MSKKIVIVIDGELKILKLARKALEGEGDFEVHTFGNPIEAYYKLKDKAFDLISLDHKMPEMTGTALLKLLSMSDGPNRHTPALLFTTFMKGVEVFNSEKFANIVILPKPFQDKSYLRNVKIALKMSSHG